MRTGIGFAPEERKAQGLWRSWSLARNVSVADLARFRVGPFVDRGRERKAAAEHLGARPRPRDVTRLVAELSGGNQQKVVLARWLLRDCKVLLLDEPTRGVDVGAKAEIYRVIRGLAEAGLAIVVVSSELDELLGLCDRILVLRDGRLVADLDGTVGHRGRAADPRRPRRPHARCRRPRPATRGSRFMSEPGRSASLHQ